MKSRRNFIGSLGVVLLLACSCTSPPSNIGSDSADAPGPKKYTVVENAGRARYRDPRLFEDDIGELKGENVFVHVKTRHVVPQEGKSGPYSQIYAVAEVRDSDTDVSVVITLSDKLLPLAGIPLLVDECYRFYTHPVMNLAIIDPVTGAESTVPFLSGYYFEPLAHDGVGGCESP